MSSKFSVACLVFQGVIIILYGTIVEYGKDALPPMRQSQQNEEIASFYPMFQDVNVMIFIGFGYLMTFLKKYGFGAVGYNFLISCVVIEWATVVRGLLAHGGSSTVYLDITGMVGADFTAGTVLITFGALLGKISRLQLLIIGILETVFAAVNEIIIIDHLKISDVGGSLVIHCFGAYFGLSIARILYKPSVKDNDKEGSVYHSDLFSMVGTIFLWMFWPSFNAVLLGPSSQQLRAVINTFYCLSACCVTVFAVSPLVNRESKLDMVHIQNATLAGGVAVGTSADMVLEPWGACLLGVAAGTLSTIGFSYVTPFLCKKLNVHDTCGVNNLHGMPAILAGFTGAIAAAMATKEKYGINYTGMFPALGEGRTPGGQGGFQALAVVVTLAIAIVGGIITGFIVKMPIFDEPDDEQLFDDDNYWEVPSGEELTERTALAGASPNAATETTKV